MLCSQVLSDTFGEFIRTTIGRKFPAAGHADFDCDAFVGVCGNALWYGSLADATMIVEASFIKVRGVQNEWHSNNDGDGGVVLAPLPAFDSFNSHKQSATAPL